MSNIGPGIAPADLKFQLRGASAGRDNQRHGAQDNGHVLQIANDRCQAVISSSSCLLVATRATSYLRDSVSQEQC